jgi:hypothetical protein
MPTKTELTQFRLPGTPLVILQKNSIHKWSTAGGSMFVCVLAIDGFPSPRIQPDVESPRYYYTDQKSIYCLNIIAAVHHLGRFNSFQLLLREE